MTGTWSDPAHDDVAAYDPDDFKNPSRVDDLLDRADDHRKA